MALVVVLGGSDGLGIVQGLGLHLVCLRGFVEVFVIADGGRDAVELEADAGSAGPSVCGSCIAFDLAPATAFACAHDWGES
jgi:hypothetical protein